jgi:hypothetical protein
MSNKNKLTEDKVSELKSLNDKLVSQKKELASLKATLEMKQNELRSDTRNKQNASQAPTGTEAKDVTLPVLNKKIPDLSKYIQSVLNPQIKQKIEDIKNTENNINLVKSRPEESDETKEKTPEETMEENRIIKMKDFKSIVENYTKISLSESEIMSILVQSQNPTMTKSELVESIQNNLIIEARMNSNVKQKFDSGENDYSGILDPEVVKNLADESFSEIARNIQQKTGKQNVTINDVQELLGNSLMSAAKKEYSYGIDRLERKAVEMIRKQFNIPEDAVEFEATITGIPSEMLVGYELSPQEAEQLSNRVGLKVGKVQREGLKIDKGNKEVPQGKTSEELKPKVKRRRITNAMMHGAARKSQNLHHMEDELRTNDPSLNRDYANLMAANDASYFLLDDQTIKQQGQGGIHAGNTRVQLSREPNGKPKIIAQGMVFPILLHELAKGVVELMSLWSLPTDAEERSYVLDKTDNLESETNDIRLGTKIWEKFVNEIPVDNQEVISLTWNYMQNLSDYEFNVIIDGLLNNSTDAKNKVKRMAEEAIEELRLEGSDEALGVYGGDEEEEEGDVATPEAGDEEGEYTDPVLKKLLGGNEQEESPQETDNLEDMSDDQLRKLMMSAIEDEDYEFASQIRDILKNR